jgi:hypothetical protein
MLRFGYDFITEKNEILHPNGIYNHKEAEGHAFNLYSPPWWGELLNKNKFDWSLFDVKTLTNSKLDSKWVYMLEVAGDVRGWLGKYDDGTTNVVKSLTSGMSKEAITEVQNNNAIICVYQAGEAAQVDFINIHLYEEFYKELLSRKISPSNFVFVTGNMIAKKQFNEWKPNSKYKNEKDFHIIEFSGYRHINYVEKWNLAKKDIDKNIEKHFLCYNRNMTHPHRLFIVSLLENENLIDSGLVSYPEFSKEHFSGKMNVHFNLGKVFRNRLLDCAERLRLRAPSIIDVDEWNTNHFDTSPPWLYEKTFFSLVSESQVVEDTLFLSEKIWKAIANRHPFILVGSYKTLDYLHKEGFKTFDGWIDESYDKEKHPYKRISKIMREVKKLCSMSKSEMNKFLSEIDDIIEYNYDKLINNHDNIDRTFKELEAITNE